MNYKLNIPKLIEDSLPSFLRTERQLLWLNVLLSPVVTLRDHFTAFVAQTNKRLQYNGQTILLRELLRTRFDDEIEITNSNTNAKPFYVYGSGDARNPKVYVAGSPANPFAGAPNSFDINAADFTVEVPSSLSLEEREEMTALINAYKVYSKRFKIQEGS